MTKVASAGLHHIVELVVSSTMPEVETYVEALIILRLQHPTIGSPRIGLQLL